jgi:hypothetical protein
MAKYAIVWTTSKGYMPGTNAALNALELYGFDVDTYVMTLDDIGSDYKANFPKVKFLDIERWNGQKSNFWYCVFSDLKFGIDELFKNYRVVLFWGGDICIVDNFMEYFEICDKLDTVILGSNEHHGEGPINLPVTQPYKHTWSVPYADIPFFVPNTKQEIVKNVIDYQFVEGAALSRMDGLNYSVRDVGDPIMCVPGHMWVMNAPYWGPVKRSGNSLLLFGSKMKSFHRKYWIKGYATQYTRGNELAKQNVTVFNHMYQHLGLNQRVKWDEGFDKWQNASDL